MKTRPSARSAAFKKPPVGFFKRLFGLGPKSASDYLDQGNAYFHRRSPQGYIKLTDLSRAIAAYIKAIGLEPKLAPAYQPKLAKVYQYRGDACLRQNDPDRAIKDYTEAIRLLPPFAVAYYYRALAHFQKGLVDKAFADCNEAIRLQPDYWPPYIGRADCFLNKGDIDRAIADDTEAIRLEPKHAPPTGAGVCYTLTKVSMTWQSPTSPRRSGSIRPTPRDTFCVRRLFRRWVMRLMLPATSARLKK